MTPGWPAVPRAAEDWPHPFTGTYVRFSPIHAYVVGVYKRARLEGRPAKGALIYAKSCGRMVASYQLAGLLDGDGNYTPK